MNLDLMTEYIKNGREIEFSFDGKMYSITQGKLNGVRVISFCEFNKESTEVSSIAELMAVQRSGVTVLQMLKSVDQSDIWIY